VARRKSKPEPEQKPELGVEAFGVRVAIEAMSDKQLDRIRPLLPPGWRACAPEDASKRWEIDADPLLRFVLSRDGDPVIREGLAFEHLLLVLEQQVRSYIALHAPELIFVHAGVVALGDRLLVIPGMSFSGKTTLVAELVRRGATYYSDEYALLDADGLVHPYPRPLSIRNGKFSKLPTHIAELGGMAGDQAQRITDIIVTQYKPGAEWNPRQLSGGESVLAMLSHTVAAQSRPEQVMRHITRAVPGARALEGPRGESEAFADMLLDELRS
jgi:hypothetical protein